MKDVVLASFDRVPSSKGASQHILANARILRERFDVSLVTLGDAPLSGLRHLAIAIPEKNWLRRAMAFRACVERVFAENEFDVYHVRSPWEGHAVPAGRTILYEVNGVPSIELAYTYPDLLARPSLIEKLRNLENALLDRAAMVVTPSEVTRAYLEDRGVESQRIAVVPNAPSVAAIDEERPERDGPVRLCYVGTSSAWQGLDDLVTALARIDRRFTLTLVLPAADRRLEKLVAKRGLGDRARFVVGADAAALAGILADADIGLCPLVPCARNLIQGCMPIKLLDYMAAGLAVLAPDMPVVRRILGDEHPLCHRHGRRSMVETLVTLMDDPALRRRLGEEGRRRVKTLFSPDAQRVALLSAYERIAS
jgi:glycosyltransferase involved in cell wall biosynthesis